MTQIQCVAHQGKTWSELKEKSIHRQNEINENMNREMIWRLQMQYMLQTWATVSVLFES